MKIKIALLGLIALHSIHMIGSDEKSFSQKSLAVHKQAVANINTPDVIKIGRASGMIGGLVGASYGLIYTPCSNLLATNCCSTIANAYFGVVLVGLPVGLTLYGSYLLLKYCCYPKSSSISAEKSHED